VKIIIQKPKQSVFCIAAARVIKNKTHKRERKQTTFFLHTLYFYSILLLLPPFCGGEKMHLNTSQIQRVFRMQSNEEEIEEERIIIIAQ